MRRGLIVAATAAVATGLAAGFTSTPTDPGEHGTCGTLFGGGFISARLECEQTRGVFRSAVLLGLGLGAVLALASVSRRSVIRGYVLVACLAVTILSAATAAVVGFGGHIADRWVFVFPALVAGAGCLGAWSVLGLMRSEPSTTRRRTPESDAHERATGASSWPACPYHDESRAFGQPGMMAEIQLTHDWLGLRLVGIGSAEISHDRLGFRPNRVGDLPLVYDQAGTRLRTIGSRWIDFERGNRARRVGDWELAYDRHGVLPTRIGPYEVGYERSGINPSQLRTVGPLTVGYDRRCLRQNSLTLHGEGVDLSEELLVAFFMVRHLLQRPKPKYAPIQLLLRAPPLVLWLLSGVAAAALGLVSLIVGTIGIAGIFNGYPAIGVIDFALGAVGLGVAVHLARRNRRPRK